MPIKLPTNEQVRSLWDTWSMLPNIRAHSQRVCRVGIALWQWLNEHGFPLQRDLIEKGALLHDIAKAYCLDKPELHHNLEGQLILEKLGYTELAALVGKHVNLPGNYRLDEAAIVFYADKRVLDNKIVSLDERYKYILKVYGQNKPSRIESIQRDADVARKVEKEIFSLLPNYQPLDLCNFN